jgi:hypothetical protein
VKATGLIACAALLGFGAGAAAAQPTAATKADSGWVPLFNGTDFTGLYDYVSNTGKVDVNTQTTFKAEAGIIKVSGTPGGYLGTLRQYSHYHVRVEYQWPVGTLPNANSGLLIHLDSAAIANGFKSAGRPRSIEVNCRRDKDFPWSLWSAANLGPYVTTTVTAVPEAGTAGRYNANGVAWTNDPYASGDTRVITGDFQPNPELPLGQWNRGEAYLYGGDSGVFILNGQVRTRGRNFQTRANAGSATPKVPCTRGNIGLQSEGAPIAFRNFEIRELDSVTQVPLHARRGCTHRAAENYDPRAVVDDASCSATSLGHGGGFGGNAGARKAGSHLRFVSNALGDAWIDFPAGSMTLRLFTLTGRPAGTYRAEAGGVRLPPDAPRELLAAHFAP